MAPARTLAAQAAAEAADSAAINWWLLDPATDSVRGIGVQRAYRDLLAGKQPRQQVVVAIIDSGIDVNHPDLQANIWTNPREVAGNGQDDDGNGYVDDVHGWDFIGGPNGQDVDVDTYEITRVYAMRIRFAHLVPVYGHDTYARGSGRLHIKLLDLLPVADSHGHEYDISELITYLNDAVLLAPSMLLNPATAWTQADDHSFDVTLTDAGHTVSARVFLDERGAPVDFHADRYATLPDGLVLARWRTPVTRWETAPGRRPLPGPAMAVYDLPDGPFPYAEGHFVPDSLAYNIPPGHLT